MREYTAENVLHATQDFVQKHPDEWLGFNLLTHYLHEQCSHLKHKRLGSRSKKYNSPINFIADYPDHFQLRSEPNQRGVYWIRLSDG